MTSDGERFPYLALATLLPLVVLRLLVVVPTLPLALAALSALAAAALIRRQRPEAAPPVEPAPPRLVERSGDPDRLVERLVPAVEELLAGSNSGRSPDDTERLRTDLHGCIRGVVDSVRNLPVGGESREVTVILSDLRGFSVITETYAAREVVDLLNRYFSYMCEIIYRYGGTVDKFMGDGIMALFGAPVTRPDDIQRAVSCAVEMQMAMDAFNRDNENLGMPNLFMGIGINTGQVVAGKIGSELHSEYTVIGDEVNLASRIEAYTLRGQILISENTYLKGRDTITVRDPIHVSVKGKREPVPLYELLAVSSPRELSVPEREVRRSLRVDVNIPFEFHLCEGKTICSESHEGRILNISAGGFFGCTLTPVEPFFNVQFFLEVGSLGLRTNPIYGKILRVNKCEEVYEMNVEFTIIDPGDRQAIKDLVNRMVEGSFAPV